MIVKNGEIIAIGPVEHDDTLSGTGILMSGGRLGLAKDYATKDWVKDQHYLTSASVDVTKEWIEENYYNRPMIDDMLDDTTSAIKDWAEDTFQPTGDYATRDELSDAIDSLSAETDAQLKDLSDVVAEEFVSTSAWVDEKIANLGGFEIVDGNEHGPFLPVEEAKINIIYLVKISEGKPDNYAEWIVTGSDESKVWTCIGETTMDLSDYAKTAYVDEKDSTLSAWADDTFAKNINVYTKDEIDDKFDTVDNEIESLSSTVDELIAGVNQEFDQTSAWASAMFAERSDVYTKNETIELVQDTADALTAVMAEQFSATSAWTEDKLNKLDNKIDNLSGTVEDFIEDVNFEFDNTSAWASATFALKSDTYTKEEVDKKIADFGGFEIVPGTNAGPNLNVDDAKRNIIYLVQNTTLYKDNYSEWIVTGPDGNRQWSCIGETSLELSGYATTEYVDKKDSELSGAIDNVIDVMAEQFMETSAWASATFVSHDEARDWDIDEYSAGSGISISGHVISLSAEETELSAGDGINIDSEGNVTTIALTPDQLDLIGTNGIAVWAAEADNYLYVGLEDDALSNYYTKDETSGVKELSAAFETKQDELTFGYDGDAISSINSIPLAGQKLEAGTDLVINDGVIRINTNGSALSANMAFVAGINTYAEGSGAAAFGVGTSAENSYTFAEGCSSRAVGYYSHAEGYNTYGAAPGSHAEGNSTSAMDWASHAEGKGTIASAEGMHAGGTFNKTTSALFVIGNGTANDARSDAFIVYPDGSVSATGKISAAGVELGAGGGSSLTAGTDLKIENDIISVNTDGRIANSAEMSFVAGSGTYASGYGAAAFGINASAIALGAVAFGVSSIANESAAFAEGWITSALAGGAHSEGMLSFASGYGSHAEGGNTSALGAASHAEGFSSRAFDYAHAEGMQTSAIGDYSHAEGLGTIASAECMHAGGKYNATTTGALFVIGNGTDDNNRSDAFIVTSAGLASATVLATSGIPDIEAAISDQAEVSGVDGIYISAAQDGTVLFGISAEYATDDEFSAYYTKIESDNRYVQISTTNDWDITDYSGASGIQVSGHVISLSAEQSDVYGENGISIEKRDNDIYIGISALPESAVSGYVTKAEFDEVQAELTSANDKISELESIISAYSARWVLLQE